MYCSTESEISFLSSLCSKNPGSEQSVSHKCTKELAERAYAEAIAFERDQIFYMFSHNLRNQLNAISIWNYFLEKKINSQNPDIKRALTGIQTGVEQQICLIETTVNKMCQKTHGLKINRQPVKLKKLLSSVIRNARSTSEHFIKFKIKECITDPSQLIEFDADRVWQAIWVILKYAAVRAASYSSIVIDSCIEKNNWIVVFKFAIEKDGSREWLDNHIPPMLALSMRVAEAHGGYLNLKTYDRKNVFYFQELRLSLPIYFFSEEKKSKNN